MSWRVITLKTMGQPGSGCLVPIESGQDIPFDIKRVYYIHDVGVEVQRGFHAHRALQQLAVCVSGHCRFHLDNGKETALITLDRPDQGLYIGPMTWREMDRFSDDAVLMVLASDHYDEADYIRDYQTFIDVIAGKQGEA